MKDWQSQAHVKWECKYHIVILPKYRKKALYGRLRREIGKILRDLCLQKDLELLEGKAMPDQCSYASECTATIQYCDDDWVSQGQECDSDSS